MEEADVGKQGPVIDHKSEAICQEMRHRPIYSGQRVKEELRRREEKVK